MDMQRPETYLVAVEVAGLLRISRKGAYRLARDPSCPALRIGGSVRFPRERLLAWLAAREQGRGRRAAADSAAVRTATGA